MVSRWSLILEGWDDSLLNMLEKCVILYDYILLSGGAIGLEELYEIYSILGCIHASCQIIAQQCATERTKRRDTVAAPSDLVVVR